MTENSVSRVQSGLLNCWSSPGSRRSLWSCRSFCTGSFSVWAEFCHAPCTSGSRTRARRKKNGLLDFVAHLPVQRCFEIGTCLVGTMPTVLFSPHSYSACSLSRGRLYAHSRYFNNDELPECWSSPGIFITTGITKARRTQYSTHKVEIDNI